MDSALVVTTPATGTRLVALATAAAETGLDPADPGLLRHIDEASGMLTAYIGKRPLLLATYTETFFQPAEQVLLSRYPVLDITSVTQGTATLEYYVDADSGAMRLPLYHGMDIGARFDWGRWGQPVNAYPATPIVVVYRAGYADPNVVGAPGVTLPFNIQRAVLDTMAVIAGGIGRDPNIKQEAVTGAGSLTWADTSSTGGLPAGAASTMDGFRDLRL